MSEEQEKVKPVFEPTPISNAMFIKQVKEFFDTLPISRDEKVRIFRAYELELNKGVVYPHQGMQRSEESMRTFKHYYVTRCISFASNSDVKKYVQAEKEKRAYTIQTDHVEFEHQCRLIGVNNEISRANLYFDMKKNDFAQGVMRVYEEKEIYQFLLNEHYPYLKYEPQKKEYKSKAMKVDDNKRMYDINELF